MVMNPGSFLTSWIALALLSAVFTSFRHLYIKKWCSAVPAEILIFTTRFTGTILLVPGLLSHANGINNPARFFPVLAVTVILTACATILQIRVIQKESLSRSIPLLSFIPLFMIPWTILFFRDAPGIIAVIGIIMACAGAYILHVEKGMGILGPVLELGRRPASRFMLIAAIVLGLTTVCDKIAISVSSAYTYTFLWTAASAVFMAFLIVRFPRAEIIKAILNKHTFVQAALWAAAFFLQMAGVQASMQIPSGVTYVKMLTMLNVMVTVAIGGTVFKEGRLLQSFLSSLLMVAGVIVVVMAAG
jgi:drug/metabolite transporter (DMT)-like permease